MKLIFAVMALAPLFWVRAEEGFRSADPRGRLQPRGFISETRLGLRVNPVAERLRQYLANLECDQLNTIATSLSRRYTIDGILEAIWQSYALLPEETRQAIHLEFPTNPAIRNLDDSLLMTLDPENASLNDGQRDLVVYYLSHSDEEHGVGRFPYGVRERRLVLFSNRQNHYSWFEVVERYALAASGVPQRLLDIVLFAYPRPFFDFALRFRPAYCQRENRHLMYYSFLFEDDPAYHWDPIYGQLGAACFAGYMTRRIRGRPLTDLLIPEYQNPTICGLPE